MAKKKTYSIYDEKAGEIANSTINKNARNSNPDYYQQKNVYNTSDSYSMDSAMAAQIANQPINDFRNADYQRRKRLYEQQKKRESKRPYAYSHSRTSQAKNVLAQINDPMGIRSKDPLSLWNSATLTDEEVAQKQKELTDYIKEQEDLRLGVLDRDEQKSKKGSDTMNRAAQNISDAKLYATRIGADVGQFDELKQNNSNKKKSVSELGSEYDKYRQNDDFEAGATRNPAHQSEQYQIMNGVSRFDTGEADPNYVMYDPLSQGGQANQNDLKLYNAMEYVTDDERSMYNYLYNQVSEKDADDYVNKYLLPAISKRNRYASFQERSKMADADLEEQYQIMNGTSRFDTGEADPEYVLYDPLSQGGQVDSRNLELYDKMEYVTDYERDTYNKLYSEDKEAAAEYVRTKLMPAINKRKQDELYKTGANMINPEDGESNAWRTIGANLMSVPLNLMSGIGSVDAAAQMLANKINGVDDPVDFNSDAFGAYNLKAGIRETTEEGIDSAAGRFFYGTGMSMLDSLATQALYMFPGATLLLGGSAATEAMIQGKKRGLSDEQAVIFGLSSGVAEALFEELSLEKLIKAGRATGGKELLLNIFKQGFTEGSEEVATTFANTLADLIINGNKAEVVDKYNQLIMAGYPADRAQAMAMQDWLFGLLTDFGGGALSGGVFGSFHSAVGYGSYKGTESRINKAENFTGAYKAYEADLQKRGLKTDFGYMLQDEDMPAQQKLYDAVKAKGEAAGMSNLDMEYATIDYMVESGQMTEQEGIDAKEMAQTRDAFEQYQKQIEEERAAAEAEQNEAEAEQNAQETVEQTAEAQQTGLTEEQQAFADQYMQTLASNKKATEILKDPAKVKLLEEITGETIKVGTGYTASEQKSSVKAAIANYVQTRGSVTEQTGTAEQSAQQAGGNLVTDRVTENTAPDAEEQNVPAPVRETAAEQTVQQTQAKAETKAEAAPVAAEAYEESAIADGLKSVGVSSEDIQKIASRYSALGTMSESQFTLAARELFTYGRLGIRFDSAVKSGGYSRALDSDTQRYIYSLGQIEGAKQKATNKERITRDTGKTVQSGVTETRVKNGVHYDGVAEFEVDLANEKQKSAIKFAEVLAAAGINVHIFASEAGERMMDNSVANGAFFWRDGSMHIDLNSGAEGEGLMAYTIAHEFTHLIAAYSNKKFKVYANALFEALGKTKADVAKMVQSEMQQARKDHPDIKDEAKLYDIAYEEVVARASETMLTNTDAASKLSQRLQKQNKGLWNKIKSMLENVIKRLQNAYRGLDPDTGIALAAREVLKRCENVRDAWVDAAVDAIENYNRVTEGLPLADIASTDTLTGSVDGAVVKSDFTSQLAKDMADSGELLSSRTERQPYPKFQMPLTTTGSVKAIDQFEGLKTGQVEGLGGTMVPAYTVRDIRGARMRVTGFKASEVKAVNKFMDEMAKMMDEAGVTYKFIGLQDVENAELHFNYNADGSVKSAVLSAMVKNGEYPVNFDLTSICKKRVAMSKLFDELAKRGDLDNQGGTGMVELTQENIWALNQALRDAGYETACLGCFVESKRYNAITWAEEFCKKWNDTVLAANPKATYFGYGKDNTNDITINDAIRLEKAAAKFAASKKETSISKALKAVDQKAKAKKDLFSWTKATRNGKAFYTLSGTETKRLNEATGINDEMKAYFLEKDARKFKKDEVKLLIQTGVLAGDTLTNEESINAMVNSGENYQHLLRPSDLLTAQGMDELQKLPDFYGVLYGHYGSATPKLVQGFTPYNSEIALLPSTKNGQTLAEYLYTIAGVRMQSFSDFQIQNVYDYLQMVGDLAARKLPAHAYTKEISFARLLGMTGIKVNMSVMFDIDTEVDEAHAGLTKYDPKVHKGEYARIVLRDEQGDWVYNIGDYATQQAYNKAYPERALRFLQSIGFEDAVKLQNTPGYTSNVGIIAVAYSNLGIRAMLDDERIRYIIPYHKSSLPGVITHVTNITRARNYESVQNTTKISKITDRDGNELTWSVKEATKRLGSAKAALTELSDHIRNDGWTVKTKKEETGHGKFGLYEDLMKTNDPRKTVNNYFEYCAAKGELPVFFEFADHDNYYKLCYDFNVMDNATEQYAPQKAVTNTYPTMVNGQLQAGNVNDGNFDSEYMRSTIDRQMQFMEQQNRNMDRDIANLAENASKGNYSIDRMNSSRIQKQDAEYMNLAQNPVKNEAKLTEMVKKAAAEAGYDSPMLFHGTRSFGFTKFDVEESLGTIFVSNRREVAETYSGKTNAVELSGNDRRQAKIAAKQTGRALLEAFKEYNTQGAENVRVMPDDERRNETKRYEKKLINISDNISDYAKSIEGQISADEYDGIQDIAYKVFQMSYLEADKMEDLYRTVAGEVDWGEDFGIRSNTKWNEIEGVLNNLSKLKGASDFIYEENGKLLVDGEVQERLLENYKDSTGIMRMYGKTENQLVLDADNRLWNELTEEMLPGGVYDVDWRGDIPLLNEFDDSEHWINTRMIAQYAKEHGYNSLLIRNVRDNGGKTNFSETGDVYVYFDSSQLKSADNVTYDNDGNIIPLSERFNEEETDIRWSSRTKQDEDYFKAVEEGNESYQEYIIRKVAKDAGYTEKAYHGTNQFGFTVFGNGRGHSEGLIYATTKREVAANYGGRENYAGVRKMGKKLRGGDSIENVIHDADQVLEREHHVATDEEKASVAKKIVREAVRIADKIDDVSAKSEGKLYDQFMEEYEDYYNSPSNDFDLIVNLFFELRDGDAFTSFESESKDGTIDAEYMESLRQAIEWFEGHYDSFRDFVSDHYAEFGSEVLKGFRDLALKHEMYDSFVDIKYKLARIASGEELITDGRSFRTKEEMIDIVNETKDIGAYQLYVNPGENVLVVDNGPVQDWLMLKVPEIDDRYHSTDFVGQWAKNHGYSSVLVKNVQDGGITADEYILFDKNQAKSADPITYDDNGEIIPPSQRFNESSDDIRYQARTKGQKINKKKPTSNKYWYPNLNQTEWDIIKSTINNQIESSDYFIDAYTKWAYAKAKGYYVFAVYGIGSGNEPTILFTATGDNAKRFVGENDRYVRDKGRLQNKLDTSVRRWNADIRNSIYGNEGAANSAGDKRGTSGDAYLDVRKSGEPKSGENNNEGAGTERNIQVNDDAMNSMRNVDNNMSNRRLLANALETAAQTKQEKAMLQQYKQELQQLHTWETEMDALKSDLRNRIGDVAAKRARAESLAEKINAADMKLFNMSTTGVLKNVLDRERSKASEAWKKQVDVAVDNERFKQQLDQARRGADRTINALQNLMLKPREKEGAYVPDFLKPAVNDYLQTIQRFSKSFLDRGYVTKADQIEINKLAAITKIAADASQMYEDDGDAKAQTLLELPDNIKDLIETLADNMEMLMQTNVADPNVKRATLDVVRQINETTQMISTAIKNINKMYQAGRFQNVATAAKNSMDYVEKIHVSQKLTGKFGNFALWDMATPYYAFKRFGEGGEYIFNGFVKGWGQFAKNIQEIMDFIGVDEMGNEKGNALWTREEQRKWSQTFVDVEVVDENAEVKTIKMSQTQAMSLYCLLRRDQALEHIGTGGIRITEAVDAKGNKNSVVKPVHLSPTFGAMDVARMLTPRQVEVANKLQEFMSTTCSEWGNYVTMQRFGVKSFTEKNYFPIRTDDNSRMTMKVDEDKTLNLYALANPGFSKHTQKGARNAVILDDIFAVFTDHAANMAKYNSLVLPALDTMKWFNYSEQIEAQNGETLITTDDGLRTRLETAYGKAAITYIKNFMADINSKNEGGNNKDTIGSAFVSYYKAAAVGANLRVALLQPTAIFRAAMELNPVYLARGIGMKNGQQEMLKYSGLAIWKDMGFYDTNIGSSVRRQIMGEQKKRAEIKNEIVEKSMTLAEIGDKVTWGAIWNACKLQTAANEKVTGEELMEKTAELFDKVALSTQVFDSTISRSQIMRNTDGRVKLATAFMAEPTLSINMLMDKMFTYAIDAQKYGKGKAWSLNKNRITRAFVTYAVTNVAAALAESLMDAYRGMDSDDDKDDFLEKLRKAMFGDWSETIDAMDVIENMLDSNLINDMMISGKIPYLKNISSALQGFSQTNMESSFIYSAVNTLQIWREKINLANGKLEKPTKVTNYGNMTLYGAIYKSLQTLSQASGIPIYNGLRDVTPAWNMTIGKITGLTLDTYESSMQRTVKALKESGATISDEEWKFIKSEGMTKTDVENYYGKTYEKLGQTPQQAGISLEVYQEYRKAISGKKTKEEVCEAIRGLSCSKEEKQKLYLIKYAEKDMAEYIY